LSCAGDSHNVTALKNSSGLKRKGMPNVTVNIEQEYNDYISKGWQKFSDITTDILKLDQDMQHTYDAISLCSIEFLQEKLKSLQVQET